MVANLFTTALAALALVSGAIAAPAPATVEAAELQFERDLDGRSTAGFNDWNCKAQPGKDPVIFLHGLTAPSLINWAVHAPAVAANGYCTYTPQYGTRFGIFLGFASMRDSSKEIATLVDKVLTSTGASKVNLVGHSMGTTVSAYYMKFDGGKDTVNHYVGFGSNYRGTTEWGLNKLVHGIPGLNETVYAVCASCSEFLTSTGNDKPNPFLDDLARGGFTVPGPDYTTIVSKLDEIVLPYTSGIIDEPGVTNIKIQDACPFDLSGHLTQAIDLNVTKWILWALGGKKGAFPAGIFSCAPQLIIGRGMDVSHEHQTRAILGSLQAA